MRASRKCSRVLILCLFCVPVFGPIFLLKHINHGVSKGFVEDLSILKHRTEAQTLSAIEQDGNEDLKVPPMVVYKDETSNSSVNFSFNKDVKFGGVRLVAANDADSSNITESRHDTGNDRQTRQHENDTPLSKKSSTFDEKVKEMKDQLLRARAYLSFAVPSGSSHLVRELKIRMRDVERALNRSIRDSRISRSALQKMSAMESTLSKACRTYPDCTAMVKKLRAMTYNAEEQVQLHRSQENYLKALGGRTVPKSLHCLSLKLTAEYFSLDPKRRVLPYKHNLQDRRLYHFAVFSNNVLACSVVVNSTISTAREPERVVFHVVTDSLNYPTISMWFLLNPLGKATVHVESIESFQWLSTKYNASLQREGSIDPRFASELNYLRFYLPDVFPYLDKIVLLDHDVVAQRDLTRLWSINMRGKVNGAVQTCNEGEPSFRRMAMFVNFKDPIIANKFDAKTCTWAFGMNVFDLKEWRRRNLTRIYHKYLRLGGKSPPWKAGSLPIGWLTFYKHTFALDKRWHVLGLGYDSGVRQEGIDNAAVVHYDGIQKPWLDIGMKKYKHLWKKHLNYEHPFLQECNVHA